MEPPGDSAECGTEHRGKESIGCNGPHRPRVPVPRKGKHPESFSSSDQVATQTLHVFALQKLSGDLLSFPNTTHLEVKTPPGDQDGDDSDPLRSEQLMGRHCGPASES